MRIGIIIIIFHFINCNINPVQAQRSNQWMLGWIGKMDFNSGVAQYTFYNDTLKITQTTAGICDTSGEILIWTNGAAVFDTNRDTMPNGSLIHLPFSQSYEPNGMPFRQGAIVLPFPGNETLYYLFHASLDYYPNAGQNLKYRANIYHSKVDMTYNGGLGSVISNSQFLEDSIHWGSMVAIKHANGRDWWLISHEVASTNWFIWLINPQGISLAHKQSMASTTAGTASIDRSIGQMSFSPDGDLFAYLLGFGGGSFRIEVMDFDRCTGLFGNVLKTDQPLVANNPGHLGSQFSPSGRYLYVTATTTLHQYDFWAPDFAASRVLIDTYNGTQAPFSATFSHMKLAPDGKIYCHASNGNWTLHVINEPDSVGAACGFVQNQFSTGIFYSAFASIPNMPNYELGPLVGSPCDTLTGVAEIHSGESGISIYPNPTAGSFSIQLTSGASGKVSFELLDLLGRKVYEQEINNHSTTQIISLPVGIANGVHVCRVVTDVKVYSEKLVVER